MESVVKNIEKIRKEKGYSHEYMALKLGISQASYTKLEKNITKLTVDRLFKISKILDNSIYKLLELPIENEFKQTNRDQSTGYLQKIDNFYQENKEQYQKIIEMYELRLKDKEVLINHLLEKN